MTFGLDGVAYEIDLSEKNAGELRAALGVYTEAGRRAGRTVTAASGRGTRRAPSRPATDRAQNRAIREWARSKKIKLSDRGRIPAEIVARYEREAGR